jgi:short-subunit dehydrogenase
MAVYYASKAYVLSFSEALHRELGERGIRVTALCPGPVPTEFQARAGLRVGRAEGVLTVSAAAVARAGYAGFMRGQRVVVPGLGSKLAAAIVRAVPNALLLRVADSRPRATRSGRDAPRT